MDETLEDFPSAARLTRDGRRLGPQHQPADLSGKCYGQLTVIDLAYKKPRGRGVIYFWNCLCTCGRYKAVAGRHLKSGGTYSCGCARMALNRGSILHPREHSSWRGARSRCENPNHPKFYMYGAAGVTFTPRWYTFDNFLIDMGTRPEGMSLDRFPDPAGNYEPDNCRWATPLEQRHNRRR